MLRGSIFAAALAAIPAFVDAYGINVYWGQKGNTMLKDWCDNAKFDYVTIGFINNSPENDPSKLKYPGSNFAAHCAADTYKDADGQPSLLLSNCNFIAEDIPYCQSKGKKVLLSIGGAVGEYDVTGKQNGEYFAKFLFDAFGPYNPSNPAPRPFDFTKNGQTTRVSVDGFDFDIEHKQPDSGVGYVAMVNKLNALIQASGKNYLVTAAPECPLDTANFKMKPIIDGAKFDLLFIQFYNNPGCDGNSGTFNFNQWVQYLSNKPSKNAKLFLGLPGDSTPASAGSGYMQPEAACTLVNSLKSKASFGGVMLWDLFTANGNEVVPGVSYLEHLYKCVHGSSSTTTSTTSTKTWTTSTWGSASTTSTSSKTSTTSTWSSTSSASTSTSSTSSKTSTTSTWSSTSSTSTSTSSTSSTSSTTSTWSSTSSTSTSTSSTYSKTSTTSTTSSTSSTSTTSPSSTWTWSHSGTSTTSAWSSASSTYSRTSTRSATSTDDDYCWEEPTEHPSSTPTGKPTGKSSDKPTGKPSATSSAKPTGKPTITRRPPHVTYVTLTTSIVYTESCETITPTSKGGLTRVVTRTIAVSTTVCPVTITADDEPTATPSWPAGWTTSTVYATRTHTITSCAPTVTNCPGKFPYVTTEVVPVSTTVCPISDVYPKPTGKWQPEPEPEYTVSSKVTNTQFTTLTIPKPGYPASSAAPIYSKPAAGPDASYPVGAAKPTGGKPAGTATGALPVVTAGAARNSVALGLTGVAAVLLFAL